MAELLFTCLEPLLASFFAVIGYVFGAPAVYLLSWGSVKPESLFECGKPRRRTGMRKWSITYVKDGRRHAVAPFVALLGWAILVGVSFVVYLIV